MYTFMHLFHKCLLSNYCVPSTAPTLPLRKLQLHLPLPATLSSYITQTDNRHCHTHTSQILKEGLTPHQ